MEKSCIFEFRHAGIEFDTLNRPSLTLRNGPPKKEYAIGPDTGVPGISAGRTQDMKDACFHLGAMSRIMETRWQRGLGPPGVASSP